MEAKDVRKYLLGGVSAIAMGAGVLGGGAALIPISEALAQTSVQQSASRADAASFMQQSAGLRTTCSTSQDTVANLTITITPPAGNYVYLTGLYIEGASNATAASSVTVWSSTNLTGNPAWLTPTIASAAANPSLYIHLAEVYPTAVRSTVAGTPVTILPQATSASAFLCAKAVGYFSP